MKEMDKKGKGVDRRTFLKNAAGTLTAGIVGIGAPRDASAESSRNLEQLEKDAQVLQEEYDKFMESIGEIESKIEGWKSDEKSAEYEGRSYEAAALAHRMRDLKSEIATAHVLQGLVLEKFMQNSLNPGEVYNPDLSGKLLELEQKILNMERDLMTQAYELRDKSLDMLRSR